MKTLKSRLAVLLIIALSCPNMTSLASIQDIIPTDSSIVSEDKASISEVDIDEIEDDSLDGELINDLNDTEEDEDVIIEEDDTKEDIATPSNAEKQESLIDDTKDEDVIADDEDITDKEDITTPSNATPSNTKDLYYSDTEIILPEPTRKGYRFVEWNTEKDGTGDSYQSGEIIEIKSINLYAIWEEAVEEKLTLYANGGSFEDSKKKLKFVYKSWIEDSESEVELPEPEREGYIFQGYCTSKDGEGDWYYSGDTVDIFTETLYAIWEKEDVKITDSLPAGSVIENVATEDIEEKEHYESETEESDETDASEDEIDTSEDEKDASEAEVEPSETESSTEESEITEENSENKEESTEESLEENTEESDESTEENDESTEENIEDSTSNTDGTDSNSENSIEIEEVCNLPESNDNEEDENYDSENSIEDKE